MKRLLALAVTLLLPLCGWAQANSYMTFPVGQAPSYEGLWWNPGESGWGVSVTHQGDVLFGVWYTYDHDGSPMWLVMPDARLVDQSQMDMMGMMEMSMMGMNYGAPLYTGTLYRTRGPAFSSASFDRNAVGVTEVGMGTFLFKDHDNGVFAYTVGDFSGSKDITRMDFGPSMPSCSVGGAAKAAGKANYQDLWWNSAESGWGVNLAHQGDTLFATWYTYDATGKGVWMVASNVARAADGRYAGRMYRATGPAYDASSWDTGRVRLMDVGNVTFDFTDAARGTFTYSVDGMAGSKSIQRMVFSLPASVCN